jgi:hypothetical protein
MGICQAGLGVCHECPPSCVTHDSEGPRSTRAASAACLTRAGLRTNLFVFPIAGARVMRLLPKPRKRAKLASKFGRRERLLHTQEVGGSKPPPPTNLLVGAGFRIRGNAAVTVLEGCGRSAGTSREEAV